jgi:hypothetical protein
MNQGIVGVNREREKEREKERKKERKKVSHRSDPPRILEMREPAYCCTERA